jgi:predicted ATP-grasp superfamily ATP-dependent carboligase
MTDLVTVHRWPSLERPILVVALEGWVDAGLAGSTAATALLGAMPHELLASFDADELIDHRARRPILRIVDGVTRELRWPELKLHLATNRTGRSVLMLTGPEPDMRWHRFIAEVVGLASRLEVEMMVGLGAFPAPVPHTRGVRLAATASSKELAEEIGFIPATLDVPAGVQAGLERAFAETDVPAVGLWARVPHYASAMPYPAAAAALVAQLGRLTGIEVDTESLSTSAGTTHAQIEQLIAGSDEHTSMVRQLEQQYDAEPAEAVGGLKDLPSGDEIAAELERFLRNED